MKNDFLINDLKTQLITLSSMDEVIECLEILDYISGIPAYLKRDDKKALYVYYNKDTNVFINTNDKSIIDSYDKEHIIDFEEFESLTNKWIYIQETMETLYSNYEKDLK